MMAEYIGLASLVLANVGASVGIYKYFERRLDKFNLDQDAKVARVYERLDEVKKDSDVRYIRKDICVIQHTQNTDNVKGLEARIEKRFDTLEAKFEGMFNTITTLLRAK